MSKIVNFYLGAAVGLASRQLVITRMPKSGDDEPLDIEPAVDEELGDDVESYEAELDDDEIFQAVLTDTATNGLVGAPAILNFNTTYEVCPGPASDASDSLFRITSIETVPVTPSSSSSSSSGE